MDENELKNSYIRHQKYKLQLLSNNIIPLSPDTGNYIEINGIRISENFLPEEYDKVTKVWTDVANKIKNMDI